MPDPVPEEIMREARKIAIAAASQVHNNGDAAAVEDLVVRLVADALMARDRRAAEIARKHPGVNYQSVGWVKWRLPSGQDIATAILTYDHSTLKESPQDA